MAIKLPMNSIAPTPRLTLKTEQEGNALPEVLTQEEAAQFLRISVPLLRSMTRKREIPARRIGERVIYGRDALLKWVNEI